MSVERRGVRGDTGCTWGHGASVGTRGVRGDTGRTWGHGACVGTRDVRGDTGSPVRGETTQTVQLEGLFQDETLVVPGLRKTP